MSKNDHIISHGISHNLSKAFVVMFRERPAVTSILWLGVFTVLFSVSWSIGIVPELDMSSSDTSNTAIVAASTTTNVVSEDSSPVRIIIDAIDLSAPITTPQSRDLDTLNEALLSGVVRYPGSADLDDNGNVFLFGHSTGFRIVQNQNYKVFNDIKNLKEKDLIRVQSQTKEYVYRVMSVGVVNADEETIMLGGMNHTLTLVTCNVFGAKEERYIVKAELVGNYDL